MGGKLDVNAPDVAIVVAAHDAEETLPGLLAACAEQDFDGVIEVVVVDDGSTDGTRAVAEQVGVRVLSHGNRGPAVARNTGWRGARAPVVLFTDSDCIPRQDWVRRMTAALDDGHPVACGGYGIANPGRLLADAVHAEILWRHSRLGDLVEFAGSYNLAVRRDVLERMGGFDERYRSPSAEDNDLSYRIRDAGIPIRFVKDAVVAHHHPVSLLSYLREQSRHGMWRVILYASHPGRTRGDGYAGPLDFVAPPLAVLSVALGLAAPFSFHAAIAAPLCFVGVLFLHDVLALRVARHARSNAALALAAVGSLRAYARGWGMLRGIVTVLRKGRRP